MSETLAVADEGGLFCPECAYDLRHTTEPRCPECGCPFDRAELAVSRIAWTHRKTIGRIKAWLRTMGMVIWRPTALAMEVARPVSWDGARLFARVNTWLVALLWTGTVAGMYHWLDLTSMQTSIGTPGTYPYDGMLPLAFPLVALVTGPGIIAIAGISALLIGGALGWWLRWWFWILGGPRREHISALACYCSAWWLLAAIFAAADAVASVIMSRMELRGSLLFWCPILVICANVPLVVGWYFGVLRLMRKSTHCSTSKTLIAAAAIPVGTVVLAAACILFVTYLLGLMALMGASLLK